MVAMDTALHSFMKKYDIPAISAAVGKQGQLIYFKTYGQADLSDGIEANNQSLFRIVLSSMSVTSLAIKKLVADGYFNYDTRVFSNDGLLNIETWRNQYETSITDITIGDLLRNQSCGWFNEDDKIANREFRELFPLKDSAFSWILNHVPLKSNASTSANFSQFNYFVLGRVIEKVTGMPYAKYVKENILQPAGITDMDLCWDTAAKPHEVAYYFPSPDAIQDFLWPRANGAIKENLYLSRNDAALGWIATAGDLAKLMMKYKTLNDLGGNKINSPAASTIDTVNSNNDYNFDWSSVDSTRDWWLQFQFYGSSTIMMRSPRGFSSVILMNTFRPDKPELFSDLARIIKMVNSDSAMVRVNSFHPVQER
jgi:CubicO group peptidase (beta-lactamase class C family)